MSDLMLGKPLTVTWKGAESVPVQMANQFLVQLDGVNDKPDLLILAIGQVTPPPVLGTEEERAAQLVDVEHINVRTLARYNITAARLSELIGLLQRVEAQGPDHLTVVDDRDRGYAVHEA